MIYANQDPKKSVKYAVSERGGGFVLTEGLSLREMQSKDGSDLVLVHPSILLLFRQLKERFAGKPVFINSGYRSPRHNQNVGGSPRSKHMNGTAIDVRIPGVSVREIAQAAAAWGVGGIGIYESKGFVHLDVEGANRRWTM